MDNSNSVNKELWETIFTDLPEVLTIEEVAKFLRVSDTDVEKLIINNDIIALPNISSIRIFKGFLLSYLTQQKPIDIGLASNIEEVDDTEGY